MLFSAQGRMLKGERHYHRTWVKIVGVFLLCTMIFVEFPALFAEPVSAHAHVDQGPSWCGGAYFSPDGNPFMLCPGPYPLGGNCVWWAWEQWHLLGYDLPLNWGNAAEWAIDATRSGFTVGTVPRVGSIAVFPVGDGAWAAGPAGHVAFVSAVSEDASTFDVTYQNFNDPKFMYADEGYNVAVINEPRYQNGQLRFIYFPRQLNSRLFAKLPGINGDPNAAVARANTAQNTNATTTPAIVTGTDASASPSQPQPRTYTNDRIALGLSPASSDQEFNADFTGNGSRNLLLYNRQRGNIQIYKLDQQRVPAQKVRPHVPDQQGNTDDELLHVSATASPIVDLGDASTPAGSWGSSLDIHVGNFSGGKASDILLYDRVLGTLQLLSLTPELHINKHRTLSNLGSGWELSVGRFTGQNAGVFMYKRFSAASSSTATSNTPDATQSSPTATPALPTANLTPTSKATPTVKPTATPTPTPTPTPTLTPTVTPIVIPTATTTPTPVPMPVSTATVAPPTPTVVPTATAPPAVPLPVPTTTTVTPVIRATQTTNASYSYAAPPQAVDDVLPTPGGDLSGSMLTAAETLGRTENIQVLDFNADLSVHQRQSYTLWHSSWEVYVGRFVNAQQDGIFLYDRTTGEGRIMDFDQHLLVHDYHEQHNLDGNWVVYSGDFVDAGRAQLLLYDPSSGDIQMLKFDQHLSLSNQKTLSNVGAHQVLYVGHFGMPTLSVMLYNSQAALSTFMGFDQKLDITHQYLVKTWDQRWQILVGSFTNSADCGASIDCRADDTILVLNRQSGQLEQYVFSFGRAFTVYDNRIQSFLREGVPVREHVQSVDTTLFSMINSLSTSIKNEELY